VPFSAKNSPVETVNKGKREGERERGGWDDGRGVGMMDVANKQEGENRMPF